MKGRGVRVIDDTDLPGRHPRRRGQEPLRDRRRRRRHRERARRRRRSTADRPCHWRGSSGRSPSASATRTRSAIASRLARLDRRLTDTQRTQLAVLAAEDGEGDRRGTSLRSTPTASSMRRVGDGIDRAVRDEIAAASKALFDDAIAPLAHSPELRERIVEASLPRAGDRRDLRRRRARGRLLAGGDRPRP